MITIRAFADCDSEAVASIIAATMRASNSRDYSSEVPEPLIAYFTHVAHSAGPQVPMCKELAQA